MEKAVAQGGHGFQVFIPAGASGHQHPMAPTVGFLCHFQHPPADFRAAHLVNAVKQNQQGIILLLGIKRVFQAGQINGQFVRF